MTHVAENEAGELLLEIVFRMIDGEWSFPTDGRRAVAKLVMASLSAWSLDGSPKDVDMQYVCDLVHKAAEHPRLQAERVHLDPVLRLLVIGES